MIQKIIEKIKELEDIAANIEVEFQDVTKPLSIIRDPDTYFCHWETPRGDVKNVQRKVFKSYQKWYSTSLLLVRENMGEERIEEFINEYKLVKNYLLLSESPSDTKKEKYIDKFINGFDIQIGILSSIPDVLETKELSLRNLISGVFLEKEIEQAEILLKNGFVRAAGALTGVALEKRLETMCYSNNISFDYKDSINPLATKLYKSKVLDITEFKRIEYWASIRNKCDHTNEINENEVKELLIGVKKFI